VAASGKVRNPLLLLGYVSFALGNMPLGLLQMADVRRVIELTVADRGWLPRRTFLQAAGGVTPRGCRVG
jgi:hypothetical protein